MYCTWHCKRNSSLTCTLGFSATLLLVSLFAWHALFIWVGNNSSSFRQGRNYGAKCWHSWEMRAPQLEQKAWLFDIQWFERLEENLRDFLLHLKETTFCLSDIITCSFKRRRHRHVFIQSSFDADCFLLWNFSKLVLKSFTTRHHLFNLYQSWKTFLFSNILRSFACRLQLSS